jgi:hypothetical protein
VTASSGPARKPTPRAATPADAPADAPAKDAPAKSAPAKETSAKDTAAKDAAAKPVLTKPDAPAKDTVPAKAAVPAKDVPAKDVAAKAAPAVVARPAAEPSMGKLVSDASTHLSNLVHSEIELAKLELRSTVKNAGTGAGLFGAAAVVLVFSLTFGFFALAEGIAAMGLDRWLAFLIVFVLQLVVVGLCVYIGIKKVKRVKAPARTIKTTRETVDYLKRSRG